MAAIGLTAALVILIIVGMAVYFTRLAPSLPGGRRLVRGAAPRGRGSHLAAARRYLAFIPISTATANPGRGSGGERWAPR